MIKEKFPGIRPSFFKGYKNLFDRDFFGVNNTEVKSLELIDRINLHFKLGMLCPVEFTFEEQEYVNKVAECETWEDVVAVATELYGKAKKESEPKTSWDDIPESGEGEGSDADDFDYDYQDDFSDGQDDDQDDVGNNLFSENDNFDPVSETDVSFREKEVQLLDDSCQEVAYVYVPTIDLEGRMIGYKDVYKNFVNSLPKYVNKAGMAEQYSLDEYSKVFGVKLADFNNKNSRYINHLVKEFELRKNAKQLARASVSKTGELDMKKIGSYRWSEDLFRRVTIVPEGKNHGLVIFLDLSGSMYEHMEGCIEQTIIMTMFCRKVNIPFAVYGFSDSGYVPEFKEGNIEKDPQNLDLALSGHGFRFREYLTSRMSRSEYNLALKCLLSLMGVYKHGGRPLPGSEELNGTPLDEAIVASIQIVNNFRKQHKVEVLTSMFITDGESSSPAHYYYDEARERRHLRNQVKGYHYKVNLSARGTNISVKFDYDSSFTRYLLQVARQLTEANYIGFYLVGGGRPMTNGMRDVGRIFDVKVSEEMIKQSRKEKFFAFENIGFNSYFVVPGGKNLKTDNGDFIINEDASKSEIRRAFANALSTRATSRVFLSRFCNTLCTTL
jgi:hypothetical protein